MQKKIKKEGEEGQAPGNVGFSGYGKMFFSRLLLVYFSRSTYDYVFTEY